MTFDLESKKKNAYWTVLINVPSIHNEEDQQEWLLKRNRIVDFMYKYFVLDLPLTTAETLKRKRELMDKIDYSVEHQCKHHYNNKMFELLHKKDQMDIVYQAIRAALSVDMLSEFYNYVVVNKPIRYCEKCRRYASSDARC
jgi:hypothetical protein